MAEITHDAPQELPTPANSPTNLLNALHWRYATKVFDTNKKLTTQQWAVLEETMILSASSYGLQPWKFISVTDAKVREQLKAVSWNQSQVTDASHLVVFAAREKMEAKDIEHYVEFIAKTRGLSTGSRGVPETGLEQYKNMMLGSLPKLNFEWAARQCYIALGNLLTSAAMLGIDACPMEGFDPAAYDSVLNLPALGYKSVVIATIGFRSATDKYAGMKKVRYPASEVIVKK